MNDVEIIRRMCEKSGMSMREVSVKMGKSANFLAATLSRGGGVGVSTLANVAKICGYVLHVNGHGEIITVEPRKD